MNGTGWNLGNKDKPACDLLTDVLNLRHGHLVAFSAYHSVHGNGDDPADLHAAGDKNQDPWDETYVDPNDDFPDVLEASAVDDDEGESMQDGAHDGPHLFAVEDLVGNDGYLLESSETGQRYRYIAGDDLDEVVEISNGKSYHLWDVLPFNIDVISRLLAHHHATKKPFFDYQRRSSVSRSKRCKRYERSELLSVSFGRSAERHDLLRRKTVFYEHLQIQ